MTMTRKIAWLIERRDDGDYRHPHWYIEDSTGWHDWTADASAATRFDTKEEAAEFPSYKLIASDPNIRLTEHVFLSPPSVE